MSPHYTNGHLAIVREKAVYCTVQLPPRDPNRREREERKFNDRTRRENLREARVEALRESPQEKWSDSASLCVHTDGTVLYCLKNSYFSAL